MPPAAGTKPFAVFAAQGLGWKRQQHLLAQDILQQNTILLIITDFGLRSGNGMLRSLAIGADGTKKQVELSRNWVFDGVKTARAERLEAAGVGRAHPDVVYQLVGTAMFDDQIGTALHHQRIELADIESVLDRAGFKGQIELDRFPFQVYNCNQHGSFHRGTKCRGDLASPDGLASDYHLDPSGLAR
jgi:hypothetical protein